MAEQKRREDTIRLLRRTKRLEALLALEAGVRDTTSLRALIYFIANETIAVVPAKLAIVWRQGLNGNVTVEAVSSLASHEQNAPAIVWLQNEIRKALKCRERDVCVSLVELDLGTAPAPGFSIPNGMLGSWNTKAGGQAGFLLLDTASFSGSKVETANRVCMTYAHAWRVHEPNAAQLMTGLRSRKALGLACLLMIVALFIPVPLAVLTPAEVVARDPVIVAAPVSGVVDDVLRTPNMMVEEGELLFTLNRAEFANRLKIAEEEFRVATARFRRASQSSFGDGEGKREMALLAAEAQLARARAEDAELALKRSTVRASKTGLLLFSSRDDWIGKPVSTGERIMQIAQPDKVSIRIELPVADAVGFAEDARVRFFPDADPLSPRDARLARISYRAMPADSGVLAFDARAIPVLNPDKDEGPALRIGERGTAQITGETVSLGYFLFRKPLSALRQWTGW